MEEHRLRKKTSHSSSSDSSGSDYDRKSSRKSRKEKRQRKDDDKGREKRKHRKKKRYYSSESSDDEEERSKKRKLLKEAKRILKRHKKEKLDSASRKAPKEKSLSSHKVLTDDDYYEKNKEFSIWLKEEHGLYFSSLTTDNARRLFSDFVQAWNSGKLSDQLYSGVQSAARTDHKWHINRDNDNVVDREEELEYMKKLEKSQRKNFQRDQKDLIDELLPRATGRERLIEKKILRKEDSRMREESPEFLKDQDIMGGSDDFKQRLERERARREKKAMEKNEALKGKQMAADEKESAAMDQFKALINASGGKITIPRRA